MDAELITLAETGAAALVMAMATDLWPDTKKTVVGLFHRDDPQREHMVADQLDRNEAFVARAEFPEKARRELFGFWALELAALLRRDPSCRDAVLRIIDRVSDMLTETGHSAFGQSNEAQSGDVHS